MAVNRLQGFFGETRRARRVLVIDPGFLGDAVHLVPALRDLRRNYPDAELHAVSSPVAKEVLEMAGCVDRQWILEQAPGRRRLMDQARVGLSLRRLRFDVSFNLSGGDRNLILARIVGARRRLGWRQARWHRWSPWCVDAWAESIDPLIPVFEQRRRVLASAGLSLGPLDLTLAPSRESMAAAMAWVPEQSIHVSVSASHSLKEWPLERWVRFIRGFLSVRPDWHVVATGSPGGREQARLGELRDWVADRRLLSADRPLGVQGLAAVLKRCRLHVGADSGSAPPRPERRDPYRQPVPGLQRRLLLDAPGARTSGGFGALSLPDGNCGGLCDDRDTQMSDRPRFPAGIRGMPGAPRTCGGSVVLRFYGRFHPDPKTFGLGSVETSQGPTKQGAR